jgi:hypothetical protein
MMNIILTLEARLGALLSEDPLRRALPVII